MEYRPLGTSGLEVSAIGLGCWPMAGVGWTGVEEAESLRALESAIDQGITLIDTAYMYGKNGESERLVGRAIAGKRDRIVLATKCGLHWEGDQLTRSSSPERIRQQLDESLHRLQTDYVDLYQVHAYDEQTPVEDTAEALVDLKEQGKIRAIGVSNYDVEPMKTFAEHAPLHSNQPPYNLIMRDIEDALLPHCRTSNIGVVTYWPFYKGLLTGKYGKGYQFPKGDSRNTDARFQGENLERTLKMLDGIRPIAEACNKTLSQVIINWTVNQPGITATLCGATRPGHVEQNVGAVGWRLTEEQMEEIRTLADGQMGK